MVAILGAAIGGVPDLKPRLELLKRALADYQNDRFYASVLVVVTVMDGFVNDVDKKTRRGLHARSQEELQAWDSVVGHHYGLTHVMREFQRPVKALRDTPVFELHRHGIVHGMGLATTMWSSPPKRGITCSQSWIGRRTCRSGRFPIRRLQPGKACSNGTATR